jgi:hypothetical protein
MTDELVKRLRDNEDWHDAGDMHAMREAADLIEQQAARIAELEAASAQSSQQGAVAVDWRVGLFHSSSNPRKEVRVLADGAAQIAEHEKHHSFIRWLDHPAHPHATDSDRIRREAIEMCALVVDATKAYTDLPLTADFVARRIRALSQQPASGE